MIWTCRLFWPLPWHIFCGTWKSTIRTFKCKRLFWPGLKMFVRWRSGYPVIWEQYEHTYSIVFFFSYLLFYSTYWLFPHALGQLFCFFLYGALFFDKPLLFPNLFLNLPLFWNFVSAHSFVLSLPICIVISLLLKKILIFLKRVVPLNVFSENHNTF